MPSLPHDCAICPTHTTFASSTGNPASKAPFSLPPSSSRPINQRSLPPPNRRKASQKYLPGLQPLSKPNLLIKLRASTDPWTLTSTDPRSHPHSRSHPYSHPSSTKLKPLCFKNTYTTLANRIDLISLHSSVVPPRLDLPVVHPDTLNADTLNTDTNTIPVDRAHRKHPPLAIPSLSIDTNTRILLMPARHQDLGTRISIPVHRLRPQHYHPTGLHALGLQPPPPILVLTQQALHPAVEDPHAMVLAMALHRPSRPLCPCPIAPPPRIRIIHTIRITGFNTVVPTPTPGHSAHPLERLRYSQGSSRLLRRFLLRSRPSQQDHLLCPCHLLSRLARLTHGRPDDSISPLHSFVCALPHRLWARFLPSSNHPYIHTSIHTSIHPSVLQPKDPGNPLWLGCLSTRTKAHRLR
eukprot:TRINITY_DN7234_c0_g1_i4.p2 TRINITY_DN7234_c0_g1~~TRINITY_DN7234_c0_g1_i4.p2  ORF type:complete len:409 (-),score=46.47 TRINITY_DN7234_c0_g1_i4:561-1787(-)